MYTKELTHEGQSRRFIVTEGRESGWEVTIEQDSRVVRRVHFSDWHRLERALTTIAQEVDHLQEEGWTDEVSA